MKGSDEVQLGELDLRTLATAFYPTEAVGLVREHVLAVISDWEHLVRDFPLQLALVQVGQLYALSALFGYSLRRAVMRYQLDQLAGGPEVAGRSLKDYISSFGSEEMQQVVSLASHEAQIVLDERISALFGDLAQLWQDFCAVAASCPEEETAMMEAVEQGKVESLRITVGDLRQLVLEGTAYGFLLGNAEATVDSTYELSPNLYPSGHVGWPFFDADLSHLRQMMPWSQAFGTEFH